MKTQKRTMSHRAEAVVFVCLLACLSALGLHAATQITTFEPAAATVGNARLLTQAVTQYTQDYDERLPPTQNAAVFQTALRPYVADPAIFVSRVTGKPFIPNPAISGQSITAVGEPDTVAVFRDILPPSTTPATVGFLDGHVERGGVVQGDPETLSIAYARTLALGAIQYEQDNDEFLPPAKTAAEFKAAIYPYVGGQRFFIDPLNGKPFVPNPALSGVSISSVKDPRTTILLQSAMPYPDSVPTIAYADGHVTPSRLPLSKAESIQDASNLKQIGLATTRFAQDNNETLPPTNDYTAFETALQPYLADPSNFASPGTSLPYVLNPAVSGLNFAYIAEPSSTEEARDAQINPDGTLNHLQLDGHVRQDFYFVPKALTIGPDDQTRLLWPAANQQTAIWTLAPGSITKTIYSLNESDNTVGFTVGIDGKTRLVRGHSAITLDTIGADNTLESSTQFGPYDGWTALFLTTDADNTSRLLWQRYDSTLALWTLSPEGDYLSSVPVPTLKDGTPVALASGKDGLTRLLWKTAQGDAILWTLSESGQVVRYFRLASPPGYVPTALTFGADGLSRILWSNGHDQATVVAQAASGRFRGHTRFTLPGGGIAAQIAVGTNGHLRILWEAADGSGKLQTVTVRGSQIAVQSLTPYL